MGNRDMSFEEIQANQDDFLRRYEVYILFPKCGVTWQTLMEIGDDYETKCYGDGRSNQEYRGEYFEIIQSHIAKVASFENVHSYRFRIKKLEVYWRRLSERVLSEAAIILLRIISIK